MRERTIWRSAAVLVVVLALAAGCGSDGAPTDDAGDPTRSVVEGTAPDPTGGTVTTRDAPDHRREDIAAALLANGDGALAHDQAECLVAELLDDLGEDETRRWADDPERWASEQATISIDEGLGGPTEEMAALGRAATACGLDIGD